MQPGPRLRLRAPAKINLALHVTGRRADGYHLLDTLVVFADACDTIEVEASDHDSFEISGAYADGVPTGEDNLVLRARDLLRHNFPAESGAVTIRLEKNLPPASGIGGGSSDAAAALKALTRLWRLDPAAGELARLAAPLGADLPMCVHACPLVARGTGDEIAPMKEWPALHLVLANPGMAVATAGIFRRLTSKANPPLPPLPVRHDTSAIAAWLGQCRNDLEAPAIEIAPPIAEALDLLNQSGAILSRMSGSGATCFGLFDTAQEAGQSAGKLRRARPGWFIEAARSAGTGEHPWDG
ncbi:4-(cytidine 5'-diphospho)-2-C-methyl-D-erythritol kinase [Mesorhizobium xinjiangense]|uniref:4-(cytidine 5'-diphospho)-2-C-methyl-D-erythritol kinase n=1 Tax=Mesorhizobium xinjiangense TaxID=2678685 RepID=UPI0012ECBE4B|nr:4-(cytidine 5'-diphospho)-2-C-methyl-D-erythritol kinase [Mesorhizobium xinjiangense]